jgi:hypothetical protein
LILFSRRETSFPQYFVYSPSSGQFSRMVNPELVDSVIAMGKSNGKTTPVALAGTESDRALADADHMYTQS